MYIYKYMWGGDCCKIRAARPGDLLAGANLTTILRNHIYIYIHMYTECVYLYIHTHIDTYIDYITLHHITLHYIHAHYTPLHYITLHSHITCVYCPT